MYLKGCIIQTKGPVPDVGNVLHTAFLTAAQHLSFCSKEYIAAAGLVDGS